MHRDIRTCVGADCMAWQWLDDELSYQRVRSDIDGYSLPPDARFKNPGIESDGWKVHGEPYRPGGMGMEWVQTFSRINTERRGYCGLAKLLPVVEVIVQNQN